MQTEILEHLDPIEKKGFRREAGSEEFREGWIREGLSRYRGVLKPIPKANDFASSIKVI